MSDCFDSVAEKLETSLGYAFQDRTLLLVALTHTSFVKGEARKTRGRHNERLEFLGDAVLELVVSGHLYQTHPELMEGSLTRIRARLVCEKALFAAAKELGLPSALRLGHGEELTGGRDKPSIVSDAMEAVIGAVYLDGGLPAAGKVIMEKVVKPLEEIDLDTDDKDFKTKLQEFVQHDHMGKIAYELLDEEGPEHSKAFTMRVKVGNTVLGEGSGASKQAAGQAAAKCALEKLNSDQSDL